ncbi:MAG: hypothetical protein AAGD01_09765 [Acidobacteriota bacterium]
MKAFVTAVYKALAPVRRSIGQVQRAARAVLDQVEEENSIIVYKSDNSSDQGEQPPSSSLTS